MTVYESKLDGKLNILDNELNRELINAFNVNAYSSAVNTNVFTEDGNIVIKFDCDVKSAKEYLSRVGRGVIQELFPHEEAGKFFNLQSFPFSSCNGRWLDDFNGESIKFVVPIDSGIIFNLKQYFVQRLERSVRIQMVIDMSEKYNLDKKLAQDMLREYVTLRETDELPNYLCRISFAEQEIRDHFVETLESKMKRGGYKLSDICKVDGSKIYIKDIDDATFVKDVTESAREQIGLHFQISGNDDQMTQMYKDAISDMIFKLQIPICACHHDVFVDKDRIENGESFAFIPVVPNGGSGRYLNHSEADEINAAFGYPVLSNIEGQTAGTQSTKNGGIYAFSNRQIALLIPEIIENSVIAKTDNGYGLVVNPSLQRRKSRKHSDLSEDLDLILIRKFIPKDGKVRDYIWNCLSKSEFGLDGYDESELIEFVDKKIEEQKIVEKQLKGDLDRILMPKFTDGDGYVDFKGIKKVSDHILNSGFGCNGYSESELEAEIGKYLQPIVRPSFLAVPTTNAMSGSVHSDYSADSGRGTDSQSGSPERKRPRDSTDSMISGSNLSLAISEAKLFLDQYQQHGSSSGKIASPLQQLKPISRDYGDNVVSSGIKPLYQGQYSSFGKTCSPRLGAEVVYNKEIEVGVTPENKSSYYGESDSSSQESHLSNDKPISSSQQKSHGSLGRKTSKAIKAVMAAAKEVSAEHKQPPSTKTKNPSTKQHKSENKSNEGCVIL